MGKSKAMEQQHQRDHATVNGGNPITRSVVRKGAGLPTACSTMPLPSPFAAWSMRRSGKTPTWTWRPCRFGPTAAWWPSPAGAATCCPIWSPIPSITAVDLNTAHIALNKLKLAAAQAAGSCRVPPLFAQADSPANIAAYRAHLAPVLDEPTRRYWEGRDLIGRRRIGGFTKGIYKRGLLGNFIGVAHLLAKLYRIDLAQILAAPRRTRSARCSSASWPRCSTSASCAG
jgi:S-adenosylmethionine-diacylglycerol 3-amino-3-carboxypropyl transferase